MSDEPLPVRPTRSCAQALDLPIPTLDVCMSDLDHLLIKEAQRLPDTYAAGGVERILALADRVWFKVRQVGGGGRQFACLTVINPQGNRRFSWLLGGWVQGATEGMAILRTFTRPWLLRRGETVSIKRACLPIAGCQMNGTGSVSNLNMRPLGFGRSAGLSAS